MNVEYNLNFYEILNEEFYEKKKKTNTNITKITLELTYREYETEATLWKSDVEDSQEMVLLTREGTDIEETQTFEIEQVRKYKVEIVKEDASDGSKLQNAKFDITIGSNPKITEYTDGNGLITVDNIEIADAYTE